jgi:hypothetical protein
MVLEVVAITQIGFKLEDCQDLDKSSGDPSID